MIENPYSKLFSSIVTSSIWTEDCETRCVWITLIAIKNRFGEVSGTAPGLARIANVPVDKCRAALEKFMSPDPDSRTPDNGGRRIQAIPGGWKVLNHALYRSMMSDEERREYKRRWDRENRSKTANPTTSDKPDNSGLNPTYADADADADADACTKPVPSPGSQFQLMPDPPKTDHPSMAFERFWQAYPRKVGKKGAEKVFHRLKCASIIDTLLSAIALQAKSQAWTKDGGQYIPHPATWLNQGRWDDAVVKSSYAASSSVPPWKQAEALAELIGKHPANSESVYFRPDCTQGQKDDLKAKRKRLAELKAL